ncbi:hypothetical protein C8J31_1571 [Rhizobium sp. PP-CC-2G-626]|nr:hypothetical protein C8J31_1571 [Rhizobium sp. PP-CC-2G-626]
MGEPKCAAFWGNRASLRRDAEPYTAALSGRERSSVAPVGTPATRSGATEKLIMISARYGSGVHGRITRLAGGERSSPPSDGTTGVSSARRGSRVRAGARCPPARRPRNRRTSSRSRGARPHRGEPRRRGAKRGYPRRSGARVGMDGSAMSMLQLPISRKGGPALWGRGHCAVRRRASGGTRRGRSRPRLRLR